jgi:acyl carrier protein
MDEMQSRLQKCFSAVFPSLSSDEILKAEAMNMESWDSVASVTLFSLVEEEFGLEMDVEDMAERMSFARIMDYLRLRKTTPAPGSTSS